MKKYFLPLICVGLGYLVGVGQHGIIADNTLGSQKGALTEHFVTIKNAVVENGIQADNGSWDISYNETYEKSVATFDCVKYNAVTSLDDIPNDEGVTAFLAAPVILAQLYDGEWRLTDFIPQTEWVSGETTTDCIHFSDGQWWAAQSGPININ